MIESQVGDDASDDNADECLGTFATRKQARLVGFLRRRGADPQVADDLAQDVWRSMIITEAERGRPRSRIALMYRTARCRLVDWLRDKRRRASNEVGMDSIALELAAIGEVVRDHDTGLTCTAAADLHDATMRLTTRQLEAIALVKIDGLSYRDAAAVLGIQPNTLKEHLCEGMRRLRTDLRQKGYRQSTQTDKERDAQ
ncbi:sigma-70 family RNA polymerase sigma factor [Lentzea sp. NPDC034063]|uniref:RNA polymerase sigma factor n=1 Tax=unclassified Lentzea TaxID=2643253 RepID=UPI0033D41F91